MRLGYSTVAAASGNGLIDPARGRTSSMRILDLQPRPIGTGLAAVARRPR